MENHSGMILTGENSIHPPELSGNPTNSHLVAKQEELEKKMMNFALQIFYFILQRIL
jgi:hypothetical protein